MARTESLSLGLIEFGAMRNKPSNPGAKLYPGLHRGKPPMLVALKASVDTSEGRAKRKMEK